MAGKSAGGTWNWWRCDSSASRGVCDRMVAAMPTQVMPQQQVRYMHAGTHTAGVCSVTPHTHQVSYAGSPQVHQQDGGQHGGGFAAQGLADEAAIAVCAVPLGKFGQHVLRERLAGCHDDTQEEAAHSTCRASRSVRWVGGLLFSWIWGEP